MKIYRINIIIKIEMIKSLKIINKNKRKFLSIIKIRLNQILKYKIKYSK